MVCRTPDLRSAGVIRKISAGHVTALHYGFIMDDVQSVLDVSNVATNGYFLDVYPDPQFESFVNGVKQMFKLRNDYLTINVRVTLCVTTVFFELFVGLETFGAFRLLAELHTATQAFVLFHLDSRSPRLTTSKVMMIVWRLRGNIIRTVLCWQRAPSSMGTVNKTVHTARLGLEFVFLCFLGCMIYLYVCVCFVLPWTVESFPFMFWRWR